MKQLKFPAFSAQVRDFLGLRDDKQLGELVRTRRVSPPPRVVCGRRLWEPDHVRQAACELGVLTPDRRRVLELAEATGANA